MTGLVEDLLLLARLDAEQPLSYRSGDLAPLVVDAAGDERAAGPDHVWRLELPAPDEPSSSAPTPPASTRSSSTSSPTPGPTPPPPGTTVTARVCAGGPDVRVEIQDDGPGIPPALLPSVFERFARGDASRSRHAGSTGLGLALVHAIVTAHGGTVTVEACRGGRSSPSSCPPSRRCSPRNRR